MRKKGKRITKARVLRELKQGKSILAIFKDAGYKDSSNHYFWKQNDPKYAEAVGAILNSPFHKERRVKNSRKNVVSRAAEKTFECWQDKYIHYLTHNNDRVMAADLAGKRVTEVMAALDPASDEYDEDLHKRVLEYEARQALAIEDRVMSKATVTNDLNAQRFLLPTLPLVGDKYKKSRQGEGGDQNVNIHALVFSGESIKGAVGILGELFGGPGQKILPGSDT